MASVMSLSEPLVLRTHWWLNTAFVSPLSSEMAEVSAVSVSPDLGCAPDGRLPGGGVFVGAGLRCSSPVTTSVQRDPWLPSYRVRTLTW